jgi:hypothetical protein
MGSSQCRRLKEEDTAASPPLPPAKRQWWEKEAEAQSARDGDDPEEFPDQNFIVGRSVEEDYRQMRMDLRQAAVWSAGDHGANFVNLAGPSELPAPKEEDDWSLSSSSSDGGDADNLDFSAFAASFFF